jgi:hypothetical protein
MCAYIVVSPTKVNPRRRRSLLSACELGVSAHGIFAPHHALRAVITPAGPGRGARRGGSERPVAKQIAMTWAQRLKRVFAIDLQTCRRCGGKLKVIASIEDGAVIARILEQLSQRSGTEPSRPPFASRAPPDPSPLF